MSDTISRRGFLKGIAASAAAIALPQFVSKGTVMEKKRRVCLDRDGGDRATAYTMSNKIVRFGNSYLCTWMGQNRVNSWAFVDPGDGSVIHRGTLGEKGVDNHCAAALARTPSGTVHAITGGHHSPLRHYELEPGNSLEWQHVSTLDAQATYPSLVSDAEGGLHLTFRCSGERWTLWYARFRDGRWGDSRPLVQAQKPGYIYWTNALALGPKGRLHLVFANTRVLDNEALYHDASHLYSDDSGETWRQYGGDALSRYPVKVNELGLIGGDADARRIESKEHQERYEAPGPANLNYLQILLSNPVVTDAGNPCVILNNGLDGTADLRHFDGTGWAATPLAGLVSDLAPEYRIHMQSTLSRNSDGMLQAVIMIEPTSSCIWGAAGTNMIRITFDANYKPVEAALVRSPNPDLAQWLPALEQWSWVCKSEVPALLYTVGRNAGGFGNNKNELKTEVWMEIPDLG
ncbi:BNR-4 repeat-containing protein [Candidatus Poribacteria bacterium]